jgi:hypothetical protein
MSFVTLSIVNSVLTTIEAALREDKAVDVGVLGSFNAGVMHLVLSGREPGASEIQALQNLAASIVASDAGEGVSVPSVATPASGEQGLGGEVQPSSEPETAGDAESPEGELEPAQPAVEETPAPPSGADEALTEVQPNPITPADELFQPQSDGEDDEEVDGA